MRVFISKAGIDQLVQGNELRISSEIADPLATFPGKCMCEGNWDEVFIDGYRPWDFNPSLDPGYFMPDQGATFDSFITLATNNIGRPHYSFQTQENIDPIKEFSKYVDRTKSSSTILPFGPGVRSEDKLTSWGQLATFKSSSPFAILVDPYLFANTSEPVDNIADLVEATIGSTSSRLQLIIACDWGDRPPYKSKSSDWIRKMYVKPNTLKDLDRALASRGLKGVQVTLIESTNSVLKLPRDVRFHDRYLLTRDYTFISGTGFGELRGRPNRSTLSISYNFANKKSLEVFRVYASELVRYLKTCEKLVNSPDSPTTNLDCVSKDDPRKSLMRIRKLAEDCFGESLQL